METNVIILPEDMANKVAVVSEAANTLVVDNPASFQFAAKLVSDWKKLIKGIEKYYEPQKKEYAKVKAARKSNLDPIKAAMKIVEDKMYAENKRQQEARDAEQKRLGSEAMMQEAARADDEGDRERADSILDGTEAVPTAIAPATEKVENTSFVENWQVIVLDKKKLDMQYLEPNMKRLIKMVKEYKQEMLEHFPVGSIRVWDAGSVRTRVEKDEE